MGFESSSLSDLTLTSCLFVVVKKEKPGLEILSHMKISLDDSFYRCLILFWLAQSPVSAKLSQSTCADAKWHLPIII